MFIKQFKKVFICPCSVSNFKQSRIVNNPKVTVYPLPKVMKVLKLISYVKALFSKVTLKEISFLRKHKNFNKSTVKELLSFTSVGLSSYKKIKRYLLKSGIKKTDNIVFYSYWMSCHAYSAILLKEAFTKSKVISRCHRFDLYENRNRNNYIPLREFILKNLDTVFSISADGKNYLENKYPNFEKNIQISRLGTLDKGIKKYVKAKKLFKMVSCSWVSSVKRIDKIVDALSKIKDIEIEWTHFGDGQLFENLKEYAKKSLGDNIQFNLNGAISNQKLQENYLSTDFDVLVNVSESEGVPVSIMEAISFGIPIIATDVGGVNEIVYNGKNGILLDKDFSDVQLIDAIKKFASMPIIEYLKYRDNSRSIWEELYDAKKNYSKFSYNIIK